MKQQPTRRGRIQNSDTVEQGHKFYVPYQERKKNEII
jgi:hypothetical protein